MQACDRCHSRKIRCDRRAPKCSVCERANAECVHTDRTRDRKLSRGYVQSLEDKVRLLEERNEQLRRSTTLASENLGDRIRGSNDLELAPQLEGSFVGPSSTQIDCPASLEPQNLDAARYLARSTHDPTRQEVLNPLIARRGSRPYLGSSTNVDFVKIVASNFKESLPVPESAEAPTSPDVPTVSEDAALPPRVVAQELIDAYFAHWHITFPLLHRASLRRTVDQIYDQPRFYRDEPFHAFAFDMVLAMGSVSRNRHEWSAFTTESYFARAMNKLDKVLRLPDLVPLQALLLCCHYGVFSTLRDTSTDTWHLLGLAARFSTELGLHRRYGYKPEETSAIHFSLPEAYNLEMSRRCFWCFYNLDR
jgi:hypothetical protein